jgi:hypothetical protein
MPVVLNLTTLGNILLGPLFAFNRAGPGVSGNVVETLFDDASYERLFGSL